MVDENKKNFFDHLEDFRALMMRCCGMIILGCIVVACFFSFFADVMMFPLKVAFKDTDAVMKGLVTNSPMAIFSVLIQVCCMGGIAIAMPFIIYFIAQFISPALLESEKKILIPSCLAVLILFIIGASFSYFYVIPASLKVAIELNQLFGFELIWSAQMYYGLVVWMTLGIGLCFEFPLALFILIYLEVFSTQALASVRKYMIVGVCVLAGLITPTSDIFSLVIVALPLYVMYELTLLLGRRLENKRKLLAEKD